MSKPLRVIFCLLSVVLVASMTVACAFLWRNGGSAVKPNGNESKTPAPEISIEESVSEEESTVPVISEDSEQEESSFIPESSDSEEVALLPRAAKKKAAAKKRAALKKKALSP